MRKMSKTAVDEEALKAFAQKCMKAWTDVCY